MCAVGDGMVQWGSMSASDDRGECVQDGTETDQCLIRVGKTRGKKRPPRKAKHEIHMHEMHMAGVRLVHGGQLMHEPCGNEHSGQPTRLWQCVC